jgi:hypothetical protein
MPIQVKYAAASAQISGEERRVGHSASPVMATAARYHTSWIGQTAALARPNVAKNVFSGEAGHGWTARMP